MDPRGSYLEDQEQVFKTHYVAAKSGLKAGNFARTGINFLQPQGKLVQSKKYSSYF